MGSRTLQLDRRHLILGAGLLGAGMWAAPANAVTEAELFPLADTKYGKLKGITWSGVQLLVSDKLGTETSTRKVLQRHLDWVAGRAAAAPAQTPPVVLSQETQLFTSTNPSPLGSLHEKVSAGKLATLYSS